jgi:hypothetical protein
MLSEDMARNPMALVQAQARPSIAGVVRPTVDGMTPDDPGFRKKIPPPAPMSAIELEAIEEEKRRQGMSTVSPGTVPSSAPGVASPSTYRLLVTCSRVEGALVVGIECAPDWDVTETWTMTQESARCVAKVARALGVKIKDMSGGELGVPDVRVPVDQGPAIPDPDPPGPRDQSGHVSDVRGPGSDHAGQPVGRPDSSRETGVRAMDPESTVEFLENARREYEEELARKSREEESDGGETQIRADIDREDTLRRRIGLPPSPGDVRRVWGSTGYPDRPPDGVDLLAPGEAPAQPE